ncbi:MAG: hypothetical protein MI799_11595, partial [Desulfobacterales bacterium]|nr:hypothetical protein [Desulfobacterales bacterium]
MNKKFNILFVFILFSASISQFQTHAYAAENYQITVVVSKRIKPYMNVLEGMTQEWSRHNISADVLCLLDSDDKENQENIRILDQLKKKQPDLCVTVGPEATRMVWHFSNNFPKLYTAVLNPDGLLPYDSVHCGISLRIPIHWQVRELSMAFTNLKRIGLLFDKRNNNGFYEKAVAASRQYGVEIIPLKVQSRDRIGRVLNENWENIDGIWLIP